ncbi:hypothetical protein [Laribacter hongkongensis]|uniref:hypothetical protein n=1 Tax=Laribacter hongkongensis TaxID=168471 RepID=UPI00138AF092|nr:hypothetical protein [Laribacter hongkongensis]MCG8999371.1 hypothetical protein [Laribacter hongkongensis]MCG9007703.1 hypothetical protein [Laribacter hongkongensis]MCG9014481.1 hypothetical protein [Laribacter hongkongensis]MCG9017662.1 hypothetical protein [Laribacter hongkongensis]MCG9030243.1 hypothetical protein [Laribacter hongkongensis]
MLTLLAMLRREIAGLRRNPSAVTAVANHSTADTALDAFRDDIERRQRRLTGTQTMRIR